MSDFAKCTVCGADAGVEYPLLAGSPAFCSTHHTQEVAGRYGCDLSDDHDDFDIPDWEEDEPKPWYMLDGPKPIWIDNSGKEYWHEKDFDDNHLINIIGFLERKVKLNFDKDTKDWIRRKHGQFLRIARKRGLDL